MAVYVSPMQQLACTFNCISSLWKQQRLSASGFSAFVLSLLHGFSCITPIEAFHKKIKQKEKQDAMDGLIQYQKVMIGGQLLARPVKGDGEGITSSMKVLL